MKNTRTRRNPVVVIETNMSDGDLSHTFYSVSGALKSGRFDYLWEYKTISKKELSSSASVEEMIGKIKDGNFFIEKYESDFFADL